MPISGGCIKGQWPSFTVREVERRVEFLVTGGYIVTDASDGWYIRRPDVGDPGERDIQWNLEVWNEQGHRLVIRHHVSAHRVPHESGRLGVQSVEGTLAEHVSDLQTRLYGVPSRWASAAVLEEPEDASSGRGESPAADMSSERIGKQSEQECRSSQRRADLRRSESSRNDNAGTTCWRPSAETPAEARAEAEGRQ